MGVITERERAKYFAYLDGVADGLNESRKDVNSVLDKIRTEIKSLQNANPSYWHSGDMVDREEVLEIIDKYTEGVRDQE